MSTRPATRHARSNGAQPVDPKDAKRARRDALLAQRERLDRAEKRRKTLIWAGLALVVVAGLGWLGWWLFGPTDGPKVETLPNLGQTHIQAGQTHPPYNSVPPTSGWHYTQPAPWGVSRQPVPDEVQVHNLEHGGIMVQYDCPTPCDDLVNNLETIGRSYPSKVIVAPYQGLLDQTKHRIALTAWTKLVYLDSVDETYIRRFIAQNKDKAPEFFPD
jgi:hypothetical protein